MMALWGAAKPYIYAAGAKSSNRPSSNPRPVAERGAHSNVSCAIEPIQLPIVPLSLFSPQSLHTTAARKRAAPTGPPMAAAQRCAQKIEVRELAELRRQRAVQLICP
jgi:hypothetical protein